MLINLQQLEDGFVGYIDTKGEPMFEQATAMAWNA
jgi:hypothetical protein